MQINYKLCKQALSDWVINVKEKAQNMSLRLDR